jgi:hypothetical protein
LLIASKIQASQTTQTTSSHERSPGPAGRRPSRRVIGPSRLLIGASRRVIGPSRLLIGASRRVIGPSRLLIGASRRVIGPSRLLIGASRRVIGPSRLLIGASRRVIGASLAAGVPEPSYWTVSVPCIPASRWPGTVQ